MNRYCMWSLLVVVLLAGTSKETFIKKAATMKMNAGIITPHLQASRDFYSRVLEFGVVFESEWYILMHSPGGQSQLAFLQPEHPSQDTLFRPAYAGEGVFLTIEVPDVDAVYERIKKWVCRCAYRSGMKPGATGILPSWIPMAWELI